jgi:hypothetical protein
MDSPNKPDALTRYDLSSRQIIILQALNLGKVPELREDEVLIDGWRFPSHHYHALLSNGLITPANLITKAGYAAMKVAKR